MHSTAHRRAFTILELLIVIGIMLVLGALVVINVVGARDKADVQSTVVQLRQFQSAIDRFRVDMRRLPTQEEGLKILWSAEGLDETERSNWSGPYLSDPKPRDLWGSEWIFKVPADVGGLDFDIISAGPDRQEGTDDDISLARERIKDAGGEDAFSDFGSSSTGVGGSSAR
ncbi:MAG: type II secretion system major pseudopilin GspG [Phycisphaeraceae bacterium]|nr:type II secretion system major pseudopilin GspG [Phycisphaeraceae bacterium]